MTNWDLGAGLPANYNFANTAVKEADEQFASAQRIVKNAYDLDRQAATQQLDIEAANQANLLRIMESQAKTGDLTSAQEIQQALEAIGGMVSEPQDEKPVDVNQQIVNNEGQIVEDPKSPLIAAPNAERPPAPQPQQRPMTQRERLKAVEPLLKTPKARYQLRQMIQREATQEAAAIHTIAPDDAMNTLIKEGIIKGQPLIANDDGTYSRRMPDGRNALRLTQTEAAAFVGDIINKTNNSFKMAEDRYGVEVRRDASIATEQEKSKLRQSDTAQEMGLRYRLEQLKGGQRMAEINRRGALGMGTSRSGAAGYDEEGQPTELSADAFITGQPSQPATRPATSPAARPGPAVRPVTTGNQAYDDQTAIYNGELQAIRERMLTGDQRAAADFAAVEADMKRMGIPVIAANAPAEAPAAAALEADLDAARKIVRTSTNPAEIRQAQATLNAAEATRKQRGEKASLIDEIFKPAEDATMPKDVKKGLKPREAAEHAQMTGQLFRLKKKWADLARDGKQFTKAEVAQIQSEIDAILKKKGAK